jgi:hypothetical protein
VINNSGRTIQIRWYVDGVGWHQESLAPGHFQGGYDGDDNTNDVDVDQVQVPSGCVGKVSVSINFYFHGGLTGAWGCLGSGSVWRDLRANRFNLGLGLDGYNKAMYHEIASSKWVRACG